MSLRDMTTTGFPLFPPWDPFLSFSITSRHFEPFLKCHRLFASPSLYGPFLLSPFSCLPRPFPSSPAKFKFPPYAFELDFCRFSPFASNDFALIPPFASLFSSLSRKGVFLALCPTVDFQYGSELSLWCIMAKRGHV